MNAKKNHKKTVGCVRKLKISVTKYTLFICVHLRFLLLFYALRFTD